MAKRPAPEIDIDEPLVRQLLHDQAPELADLDLSPLGRGWDNTNWRLGNDLIVRVPHREVAAVLIDHEQRVLPELALRFAVAIPVPSVAGQPSTAAGFPWPWSVVPWIEGNEAALDTAADNAATAQMLGQFFAQLHTEAPDDAPTNPYRGHALSAFAETFNHRLDLAADRVDAAAARKLFDAAVAAPLTTEQVWLHGDLHTRNIVTNAGALVGVIDWGDVCSGDRATDLAGAFMLTPTNLATVFEHAGADEASWERARGWATHFAIMYLTFSDDAAVQRQIGERLLGNLDIELR